MPFTFAHPALVLPLVKLRKGFSATALIIGSIAPDFESFIFLRTQKIYGHTWPGIFTFDLPLAFILSYIYHYIVRDALILNLPGALYSRFAQCAHISWGKEMRHRFLIILLSFLIGSVSHMLWDGLTHLNFIDPEAPVFYYSFPHIVDYYQHNITISYLQIVSSVIGMLYVGWYIYWLPQTQGGISRPNGIFLYWFFISLITVIGYYYISATLKDIWELKTYLHVTVLVSSFLASVVIVSLFYKAYYILRRKPE